MINADLDQEVYAAARTLFAQSLLLLVNRLPSPDRRRIVRGDYSTAEIMCRMPRLLSLPPREALMAAHAVRFVCRVPAEEDAGAAMGLSDALTAIGARLEGRGMSESARARADREIIHIYRAIRTWNPDEMDVNRLRRALHWVHTSGLRPISGVHLLAAMLGGDRAAMVFLTDPLTRWNPPGADAA
ncbi:hypothetical protein [Acidomonas methanolica]|uniref:Uncharacterized protein n=1 Tax=Acidomonas methanolica NBRC 104435 TaxID=1231351 RepID=A0A023D6H8_ACIMT|nr:hypothetical protein [Acidomonas methanolica]TCS24095.1 hypothetical protein EDC31_12516 [Acidomonas methanolica]GAJ29753.1 hypothetical protein Amme_076_046 [Acidomonas methanolica NBRC 104435]GBQ59365.1 hypothetical protein AA0498_2736 [Acidomonas methanolica]GEL00010.1 hypothetical protein AME01nite_25080 [Acidomonas methanolica NBRC 104435]